MRAGQKGETRIKAEKRLRRPSPTGEGGAEDAWLTEWPLMSGRKWPQRLSGWRLLDPLIFLPPRLFSFFSFSALFPLAELALAAAEGAPPAAALLVLACLSPRLAIPARHGQQQEVPREPHSPNLSLA